MKNLFSTFPAFLLGFILITGCQAQAQKDEQQQDKAAQVSAEAFSTPREKVDIDNAVEGELPDWYKQAQADWPLDPLTVDDKWRRLEAILDRVPEFETVKGDGTLDCKGILRDLRAGDRKAVQFLKPDLRPGSHKHPELVRLRKQCPNICIGESWIVPGEKQDPDTTKPTCKNRMPGYKALGNMELYNLAQYGLPDKTYAFYADAYGFDENEPVLQNIEWRTGNFEKCNWNTKASHSGRAVIYKGISERPDFSGLVQLQNEKGVFYLTATTFGLATLREEMASDEISPIAIMIRNVLTEKNLHKVRGCYMEFRSNSDKNKGDK